MMKFLCEKDISYDGITCIDNDIYISSITFNGLLKICGSCEDIKYLGSFDEEPFEKLGLHHKQYLYKNMIFFMPDHAKSIHYYDLNTRQLGKVSFRYMKGCEDPVRGYDSIQDGRYCYIFFEYEQNPIILFDMECCQICQVIYIKDKLPSDLQSRKIPLFNMPISRCGNKIYAAVWKSHYIFEFDITTMNARFIDIRVDVDMIQVAAVSEREFYGTLWNSGNILHLIIDDGGVKCTQIPGLSMDRELSYSNIICEKDTILVIPNQNSAEESIYEIKENHLCPYLKFPDGYSLSSELKKDWRNHFSYIVDREKVILCPSSSNMGMILNLADRTIKGTNIQWNDRDYKEWIALYRRASLQGGKMYRENVDDNLQRFLKVMVE